MEQSGQSRGGTERPDHFAAWVAMLLLVYVAVGLLTWHRTLIPDEIRPLLLASGPFATQLEVARADLVQTPAAWLAARAWMNVFGDSDSVAKAFALLLNIPTLILFSILARRATLHWRITTLLCLAAYMRAGSSPNLVRMYGLLVLCGVAAMLSWDIWRQRGGGRWLAAWVVSMVVGVYAHALMLLLVPAFVLATWMKGRQRMTFTLAAVLPVLSIVPWVAFVYPVYRARGIEGNVQSVADDPTRATVKLPFYLLSGEPAGTEAPLEEFYIAHGIPSALKWAAFGLTITILGFSVLGSLVLREGAGTRRRGSSDEDARDGPAVDEWKTGRQEWPAISLILAIVPIAALYFLSLVWVPVVTARYLLAAVPAFWLMLGIHGNRGGWPGRVALAGTLLWMLASSALAIRLHLPIAPARAAAVRVAAGYQPGDLILIDRHAPLGWQFTWEWTRRLHETGDITVISSPGQPEWLRDIIPGPLLEDFDAGGASRVWFLHWAPVLRPRIEERLHAAGYAETTYPDPVGILSLFERRALASASATSVTPTAMAAPRRNVDFD
jgi:hypothetical protein